MRLLNVTGYASLAILLCACDQPGSRSELNPEAGSACFESHRFSLPPGTQYEGIGKLSSDKVQIRIMDGIKLSTIECELNPDGSLK
jgi:hypothetical protein